MPSDETNPIASFIKGMPPEELSRPDRMGGMDKSSESIRNTEWQHYLRQRREYYQGSKRVRSGVRQAANSENSPDDLTGLALSGGGIRSATFALGVLQALAHHDLLRRFDYLSTVSGGGYIGTSYLALVRCVGVI